ncbi:MAG: bifunctional [glutamate--ammonia ligase]-adenylyl-L-tyrosine phosphorylase/[glutamate--ammonia-ligase] adenylyltransferase, partial [Geobacter sp.]
MNRSTDIASALQAALAADPVANGDHELVCLLEARGYSYPARSATNLRLLAGIFPPENLATITVAALSTAMPDMALNNLERIGASIPRGELLVACSVKNRLVQLLTICGASPFIAGLLCRDPVHFRELFLDRQIDLKRDEASSLASLRARITDQTDYNELFVILRRF